MVRRSLSDAVLSTEGSGLSPDEDVAAWLGILQRLLEEGNQRKQVMQFIGQRVENEDRQWQCCLVLLIRQILVDRDEGLELCCRKSEEFAVLDA